MAIGRVVFGGPDMKPRRLRDLLQSEIEAVPPGGRIDWATYYFRDRRLARALVAAQRRGVQVCITMERTPRRADANACVVDILQRGGVDRLTARRWWPGRLHSKVYAFSHPDRCWIGSFNPSGDEVDDPDILAAIGDQDRGDNLLVELRAPELVEAGRRTVEMLGRGVPPLVRFDRRYTRVARARGTQLFRYPRLGASPLSPSLAKLGPGDEVTAAISHLKPGPLLAALDAGAARGAHVMLFVHDSQRRVPASVRRYSSLELTRVGDTATAPMHAKMLYARIAGRRQVWTGSLNFNLRSRYLNAETLLLSDDERFCDMVESRLNEIGARSLPGKPGFSTGLPVPPRDREAYPAPAGPSRKGAGNRFIPPPDPGA
ncbi:hypothetical protein B5C34_10265 [Pacificimonas flava]|uniref:Phospholipase D-like domain-containing protein n=2 Tax=Pacificimonas TaxID=1960290 RepID=A0A219B623_9SPHN|nr:MULTISPECIES: phospholipase D-like domain-containing protein [Pacificimonas]MBZ6378948.1 hypothetical protein [Pacificimonas aurantium]OWV33805.1 hypothetical protein B5C34_10265 [Pacificimonas flava]